MSADAVDGGARLRLDKWLWRARFYKSRTLAAAACSAGRVRVNRKPVSKPNHQIKAGDVLTFALDRYVRVIEIARLGVRRGPASEARALYVDLAPPETQPRAPRPDAGPARARGAGRPTKRERRHTERLHGRD